MAALKNSVKILYSESFHPSGFIRLKRILFLDFVSIVSGSFPDFLWYLSLSHQSPHITISPYHQWTILPKHQLLVTSDYHTSEAFLLMHLIAIICKFGVQHLTAKQMRW